MAVQYEIFDIFFPISDRETVTPPDARQSKLYGLYDAAYDATWTTLTYLHYNLHSEYGGKYVIKVIQHLENIARRNKAVQHYSNIGIFFWQQLYFTW